ncbi:oleosin 16.4 kDa-like [Fagus crenata]
MAEHHQPHHFQQHPQQRPNDPMKNFFPEDYQGPSTSKILAVVTLIPIGAFLLFLAGVSFVGTLIGLAVSTPLLVIFSPVLVPAALVIGLAVTGFLTSGAFGITGLSSLSWIINYLRQATRMPEHMEYAKRGVQDTAGHYGQKAREMGQNVTNKAQEVGRGHEGGGRGDAKS